MMIFERSSGWRRIVCENRRTFGFVSRDATGTFEVVCAAKGCKRPGFETRHQFNLATGEHVTECVPVIAQTQSSDAGSA